MLPRQSILALVLCLTLSGVQSAHAAESRCYGTVAKGRLEGDVKLPAGGASICPS